MKNDVMNFQAQEIPFFSLKEVWRVLRSTRCKHTDIGIINDDVQYPMTAH